MAKTNKHFHLKTKTKFKRAAKINTASYEMLIIISMSKREKNRERRVKESK